MEIQISRDVRKFLITSVVFSFVFLAILSALNYYFMSLVLAKTVVQLSDNQFNEYASSTKTLFLGDSHSRNAIDPTFIPDSFNYAFSGENYAQTYYKLRYVLNNEKTNIKVVILPLDSHSFFVDMAENFQNDWFWKRFIDYGELSRNDKRISYIQKTIVSWFPVIDNGGELINNLKSGQKLSVLIKGYSANDGNFAVVGDKAGDAKNRVDLQMNGKGVMDEVLLGYFEKTLELAKLKGVRVYLVKFPVSREYYVSATEATSKNDGYDFKINNVLERHKEATVLDFHSVYFDRPDFFHNSDHLNRAGSVDFTNLLRKNLNQNK